MVFIMYLDICVFHKINRRLVNKIITYRIDALRTDKADLVSVYLAKLYKFSVEAGVDHDVAEAAAPPPPASEALAVELQRLVPGPRHGPVLRLNNGDLRRNAV